MSSLQSSSLVSRLYAISVTLSVAEHQSFAARLAGFERRLGHVVVQSGFSSLFIISVGERLLRFRA